MAVVYARNGRHKLGKAKKKIGGPGLISATACFYGRVDIQLQEATP